MDTPTVVIFWLCRTIIVVGAAIIIYNQWQIHRQWMIYTRIITPEVAQRLKAIYRECSANDPKWEEVDIYLKALHKAGFVSCLGEYLTRDRRLPY